jgi:hypothetical protein
MKTLQTQYNLIKEGKGDKAYFMKLARHNFPDLITPVLSYNDTITVLKNKSILSEGIGGLVTTGKKQDWHAIFNENMANLKEAKEAKAEEKETTKDVTDMATRGYDYKDTKNYDNIFGQEFLKGFYTEMQDEKNKDKDVDELKAIVAKNLAKDINYYVKDGQFGLKGVGYTVDAPGLGEPKPAKGKHKSSGYGDLKESVLRSQIYLLVKEVLTEGIHDKDITSASHTNVTGKMGDYDPKARAANLASLANFGPQSKSENNDVLDYHLSVIQANGYNKDEAQMYLEDQVADLTQEQIDTIINNAFPIKEDKESESKIIDALRKKYKSDLKGVNDDKDYKNLSYKSKLKVKDYIRFDINQEH